MLKKLNSHKNKLITRNDRLSYSILKGIFKTAMVCLLIVMITLAFPLSFSCSAKTKIYSYTNIYKSNVAPGWSRYNFSGETYFRYSGSETDVTIPASCKVINRGTIVSNKKIRIIRVPVSVENIEAGAFYELTNLKRVVFYGNPTIEDNAFYGCDSLVNFVADKGTYADDYGKNNKIAVARSETTAFSKKTVYIQRGYSYAQPVCNLNDSVQSWKSSNPSVVSVDENGKIRALKKGVSTITASCGKSSYTYKVIVFLKKVSEDKTSTVKSDVSYRKAR